MPSKNNDKHDRYKKETKFRGRRRDDDEDDESTNSDNSEVDRNRKRSHHSRINPENYKELQTPLKKHPCTDILCVLLFLIFILAFVGVSVFAYMNGSPNSLILPRDSTGQLCGESGSKVVDKPFLLFFDLTKCIGISTLVTGCPTPQVCVETCPEGNYYNKIPGHKDKIQSYCSKNVRTDEEECPSYLIKSKPVFGRCVPDFVFTGLDEMVQAFNGTNNITIEVENPESGSGSTGLSVNLLKEGLKYFTEIMNLKRSFEYAYEDLDKAKWLIVSALVIGMLIAFIWILLLRWLVKPLVYLSIIAVLGLIGFGTYFCLQYYLDLRKSPDKGSTDQFTIQKLLDFNYLKSLEKTWLALTIILGVIFLILLLLIIFLRNRIKLALELITEASKAVVSIPSSLFWPVFPFILQVGILVYCVSVAVYLASAGIPLYTIVSKNTTLHRSLRVNQEYNFTIGDFCNPDEFYKKYNESGYDCYFYKYGYDPRFPFKIEQDKNGYVSEAYSKVVNFLDGYQWLPQLFVAFMLFWLSSFIVGLSEMTLSGAFGAWYWTRFSNADNYRKDNLPCLPVAGAFKRAFFNHFGTIAFGSFIIAIVKLIRVMLEYVDRKLKSNVDSKIAKFFMKCLKCCFWCLEKFIKFLNRNAYIMSAIYGYNFCRAAQKAFSIIINNILRVGVKDKITDFLLFLSKLAITLAIAILSFYFFTKKIPIKELTAFAPDLHYYFIPLVVIVVGVYLITTIFFDVFAMCVDTLFMCALIDVQINDGSKSKRYFMSKNLKKVLGVKNKKE